MYFVNYMQHVGYLSHANAKETSIKLKLVVCTNQHLYQILNAKVNASDSVSIVQHF